MFCICCGCLIGRHLFLLIVFINMSEMNIIMVMDDRNPNPSIMKNEVVNYIV